MLSLAYGLSGPTNSPLSSGSISSYGSTWDGEMGLRLSSSSRPGQEFLEDHQSSEPRKSFADLLLHATFCIAHVCCSPQSRGGSQWNWDKTQPLVCFPGVSGWGFLFGFFPVPWEKSLNKFEASIPHHQEPWVDCLPFERSLQKSKDLCLAHSIKKHHPPFLIVQADSYPLGCIV